MIIISYLKPYNCAQTNDYYLIEIINWNNIIIVSDKNNWNYITMSTMIWTIRVIFCLEVR